MIAAANHLMTIFRFSRKTPISVHAIRIASAERYSSAIATGPLSNSVARVGFGSNPKSAPPLAGVAFGLGELVRILVGRIAPREFVARLSAGLGTVRREAASGTAQQRAKTNA
jgi:hypothetical protein